VVNAMPQPSQERDSVPIVQEVGWAPGQIWMGAENFAPTNIPALDHPSRSKSLYRLHLPSPLSFHTGIFNYLLNLNAYTPKNDKQSTHLYMNFHAASIIFQCI